MPQMAAMTLDNVIGKRQALEGFLLWLRSVALSARRVRQFARATFYLWVAVFAIWKVLRPFRRGGGTSRVHPFELARVAEQLSQLSSALMETHARLSRRNVWLFRGPLAHLRAQQETMDQCVAELRASAIEWDSAIADYGDDCLREAMEIARDATATSQEPDPATQRLDPSLDRDTLRDHLGRVMSRE